MMFEEIWNKHVDYWEENLIPNNEKFWKGKEPFEGYRIFMLASAVNHESVELQRETNWKWWKKRGDLDMNKIREEIMDILHFGFQLAMEAGMDLDAVIKEYNDKLNENIDRQKRGY